MAIRAVCNSVIEIIDDCCSNFKGGGFLNNFLFCFVFLLLTLSHQQKYLLVLPQN